MPILQFKDKQGKLLPPLDSKKVTEDNLEWIRNNTTGALMFNGIKAPLPTNSIKMEHIQWMNDPSNKVSSTGYTVQYGKRIPTFYAAAEYEQARREINANIMRATPSAPKPLQKGLTPGNVAEAFKRKGFELDLSNTGPTLKAAAVGFARAVETKFADVLDSFQGPPASAADMSQMSTPGQKFLSTTQPSLEKLSDKYATPGGESIGGGVGDLVPIVFGQKALRAAGALPKAAAGATAIKRASAGFGAGMTTGAMTHLAETGTKDIQGTAPTGLMFGALEAAPGLLQAAKGIKPEVGADVAGVFKPKFEGYGPEYKPYTKPTLTKTPPPRGASEILRELDALPQTQGAGEIIQDLHFGKSAPSELAPPPEYTAVSREEMIKNGIIPHEAPPEITPAPAQDLNITEMNLGVDPGITSYLQKTGRAIAAGVKRILPDLPEKFDNLWFNHVSNIDWLKKRNSNLWKEAKMLKGGSGKAYRFLRDNLVPAFDATRGKAIVVGGVEKTLPELATDLAFVRHAETSGNVMPKRAAETIKAVNSTVAAIKVKSPEMGAAIEDTAGKLNKSAESILTYWVDKGVMSAEQAKAMRNKNPFYVPMQRVIDEAITAGAGKAKGAGNPFKKFSGKSEREIIDPAESIANNMIRFIPVADRHVFLRNVVDELMANPDLVEMLKKKTMVVQPLQRNEIVKIVKDAGLDAEGMPIDEVQRIVNMTRPPTEMGKNDIGFMRDGKWEFYEIKDDKLAMVLKDSYRPDAVIKVLRGMKNLKRTGVTLSPAFVVRNVVRDTLTSLTLDKNLISNPAIVGWGQFAKDQVMLWPRAVKQIAVDYPRAVAEILKQGELYKAIEREGGMNSGLFERSKDIKSEMFKMKNKPGAKNIKIELGSVKALINWMKNFSSVVEEMPRYVMAEREYVASLARNIKNGLSKEAAHAAAVKDAALTFREGTVDFAEMGAFTGFTNVHADPTPGSWAVRALGKEASPFYTAGIGGIRTFGRRLVENPVGTTAALFQYVTGPSIGLWLLNHNQDWYKDTSPEEKNMDWHITEHIKIPKPFEIGMIGGSMIERMLDGIVDKDPDAIHGIASAFAQIWPSLPQPPAAGALYGKLTNKDPFWKLPIENPYDVMNDASPHERSKPSSSETGKLITGLAGGKLTDWTGLSPAAFDFYVNQFTGGAGKVVTGLADAAIKKATGAVSADSEWWNNSALNPFYKKNPDQTTYSYSIQKFYENNKAADAAHSNYNKAVKAGDYDKAGQIIDDSGALVSAATFMGQQGKRISMLMKQYKNLINPNNNKGMTPKEKRKAMDGLAEQINNIAKSANDAFENAVK